MTNIQDELNAILHLAPAGVIYVDLVSGRIIKANHQFADLTGYSLQELLTRTLLDMTPPEDRLSNAAALKHIEESQTNHWNHEQRILCQNGQIICVEIKGSLLPKAPESPRHLLALVFDVTRRTRELENKIQQLRRLSMDLAHSDTQVRKRLAQLLHDDLQQILVAAKFGMEAQARRCSSHQTGVSPECDTCYLLDQAIQITRSIMMDLSPPVLAKGTTKEVVQWLIARMQKRHGLTVELDSTVDTEVTGEMKLLIFECLRELLFNIVKHSGTKSADVSLQILPEKMMLIVSDQGKGFDPDHVSSSSFGLLHLRERIECLNGVFILTTQPGRGTKVEITAPNHTEQLSSQKSSPESLQVNPEAPALSPTSKKISIVLADDHKIVREGIASLFQYEPDLEVIGQASNGREAIELAQHLHPQVILMDIQMPVMNGIEATRTIHQEFPQIHVIGLSMHQDPQFEEAMRHAGAVAFLPKDTPPSQLFTHIRAVRRPAA